MEGLQSVATTMGFSALDGLMMGTRCGALDPGVLLHLMATEKLSVEQLTDLLYHESGLLGVSGVSASPKALLDAEASDPRARAALALYVRRIVREIGALTAVLGGLDMLAFTGGVGEHSAIAALADLRGARVAGRALDRDANSADASTISVPRSRVRVAVEPTNEEWVAATHARRLLRRPSRRWTKAMPSPEATLDPGKERMLMTLEVAAAAGAIASRFAPSDPTTANVSCGPFTHWTANRSTCAFSSTSER